jgi:hypothetical protein
MGETFPKVSTWGTGSFIIYKTQSTPKHQNLNLQYQLIAMKPFDLKNIGQ